MLVFVDLEHPEGMASPWGEKLQAARTWITYRLEDLSGLPCHLVRWNRIDAELLDRLDAVAVFISGNGTDPSRYAADEVAALDDVIVSSGRPVFGFCGGFQRMALAMGVPVEPIVIDADTPRDHLVPFGSDADGNERLGEAGYFSVDTTADHDLLHGVDERPVVRHAHRLEVPQLPDGFINIASTAVTQHQMAVDPERRMVGTQFHPEYYTDEHPAGRQMITNFLRWAEIA